MSICRRQPLISLFETSWRKINMKSLPKPSPFMNHLTSPSPEVGYLESYFWKHVAWATHSPPTDGWVWMAGPQRQKRFRNSDTIPGTPCKPLAQLGRDPLLLRPIPRVSCGLRVLGRETCLGRDLLSTMSRAISALANFQRLDSEGKNRKVCPFIKLRWRPLLFYSLERKIIQKLKFEKCTVVTRENKRMVSQPSALCVLAAFLKVAGGK